VVTHLKFVLQDLSWDEEALPIEIIAMLVQSDFDADDLELRRLARRYWWGSNTTEKTLEKCFAHLTKVIQVANENKTASPYAVWLYAQGSPYVRSSGMQQIMPTAADWVLHRPNLNKKSDPVFRAFGKCMNIDQCRLPEQPLSQVTTSAFRKKPWRTSGPIGHHKSVAAMAYMMHDVPNEFANANKAWAGQPCHKMLH
jgi:hypothetical protein